MKKLLWVVALVLWASSALAQNPPNEKATVDAVRVSTGSLIAENSMLFTDAVCVALAKKDANWGRKVRREGEWESRNSDALAYRFVDNSNKALIDIVACSHLPGEPPPDCTPDTSWNVYPGPNTGNGFWMACQGEMPPVEPPVEPPTDPELIVKVTALEKKVVSQTNEITALKGSLSELRTTLEAFALRLTDIEQKPVPGIVCEEKDISTGRVWGHAHGIKIPVCRAR